MIRLIVHKKHVGFEVSVSRGNEVACLDDFAFSDKEDMRNFVNAFIDNMPEDKHISETIKELMK